MYFNNSIESLSTFVIPNEYLIDLWLLGKKTLTLCLEYIFGHLSKHYVIAFFEQSFASLGSQKIKVKIDLLFDKLLEELHAVLLVQRNSTTFNVNPDKDLAIARKPSSNTDSVLVIPLGIPQADLDELVFKC